MHQTKPIPNDYRNCRLPTNIEMWKRFIQIIHIDRQDMLLLPDIAECFSCYYFENNKKRKKFKRNAKKYANP